MGLGGQEHPAPTPVVYPVFPPALLGVLKGPALWVLDASQGKGGSHLGHGQLCGCLCTSSELGLA